MAGKPDSEKNPKPGHNNKNKKERINKQIRGTSCLQILKDYYERSSDWDKQLIKALAEQTGLTESQVYKWRWDMNEKDKKKYKQTATKVQKKL